MSDSKHGQYLGIQQVLEDKAETRDGSLKDDTTVGVLGSGSGKCVNVCACADG